MLNLIKIKGLLTKDGATYIWCCREGLVGMWGEWHPHVGEGGKGTHTYQRQTFVCPYMVCGKGGWAHYGRRVVVLGYLSHSEGVSCSTSSYIWASWYFPRFLLKDVSFTQMYMVSFMVLVTPCASLFPIVNHSKSTGCHVVCLVDVWGWSS